MDSMNENCIEFLRGQETATVTFSQGRYLARIRKLAVERPEECQITAENPDGSIVAHIPTKWIKISPPRKVSEEQRTAFAERVKNAYTVSEKSSDPGEIIEEDK
ncbi:MAG: hypothetical protein J6B85_02675 [Lachnospiraceae bacterium]|nr:hypothetical protein [Lachnospiraceae bacterium]